MKQALRRLVLVLVLLVPAACGGAEQAEPDDGAEPTDPGAAAAAECDPSALPLHEDGRLTVATGEPVFEPWMVNDDPTNQQGFEAALVYALA